MFKKIFILIISLLFFLALNINVCWKVTVNDVSLPGRYSSSQIKESSKISALAAEEICPGQSLGPILRKNLCLSFRPPTGDSLLLNDYMLLYSSGVEIAEGVYVNGTQLGTVENGAVLSSMLRDFIKNQMPNQAVFGSISGKMQLRPVFSCSGHTTDYDDMLLLVSGMAPVFYLDRSGHLA